MGGFAAHAFNYSVFNPCAFEHDDRYTLFIILLVRQRLRALNAWAGDPPTLRPFGAHLRPSTIELAKKMPAQGAGKVQN